MATAVVPLKAVNERTDTARQQSERAGHEGHGECSTLAVLGPLRVSSAAIGHPRICDSQFERIDSILWSNGGNTGYEQQLGPHGNRRQHADPGDKGQSADGGVLCTRNLCQGRQHVRFRSHRSLGIETHVDLVARLVRMFLPTHRLIGRCLPESILAFARLAYGGDQHPTMKSCLQRFSKRRFQKNRGLLMLNRISRNRNRGSVN